MNKVHSATLTSPTWPALFRPRASAHGADVYQSLVSRGVPTSMVIYPDEGHGIRQPCHQADVLRRVLAWFAEHGGEPVAP